MELSEDFIRVEIQKLTHVETSTLGFEVQLPLFFPNGTSVAVTVVQDATDIVVHDAGAAIAFLIESGISVTPKLLKRVSDLAGVYGCEFSYQRLQKRSKIANLGAISAIVANASKTIADLALQQPSVPILDFKKEVLSHLRDFIGEKRFRFDEEILGESGYSYHVSAVVLDTAGAKPIGFVEPIKDHDAATKKFRTFWDLSRSATYTQVKRISLFDDARRWDNSDLYILQEVSSLVRLKNAQNSMTELV